MPAFEKLLGRNLIKGDSSTSLATIEALASKKAVILYFSAHWCPPCRGFTPVLAEAYKAYKASGGDEAEIIYVSGDQDLDQFKGYFAEMPWLALPFEDKELRSKLNSHFEVQGIPCIVALGPDGSQMFDKGAVDLRSLVSQHKGDAFPMTPEHVRELKAKKELKAKEVLKDLCSDFPPISTPADGPWESLAELLDECEHVLLVLGDGDGSDSSYAQLSKAQDAINLKNGAKKKPFCGVCRLDALQLYVRPCALCCKI
jgi:nucleoredoxin